MRELMKKILPNRIQQIIRDMRQIQICDKFGSISYSQEGEDMVLRTMLEKFKGQGCYIDIGAHHPKRFSNTYYFYRKGWSGVNIDPRPGCMDMFNKLRRRDINLEIGVGRTQRKLMYYMFEEPAYNSFNTELSMERIQDPKINFIGTKEILVRTLEDILDEYLPQEKKVNFISIDVEGLEMEVLESNNWSKYKPDIILIESLGTRLIEIEEDEIYHFLLEQGYICYAKTGNTYLYKINDI